MTKITFKSRYGDWYQAEWLDTNVYRISANIISRYCGDPDSTGKIPSLVFIDFDGGPFISVDGVLPFNTRKKVLQLVPEYDGDRISYVRIIAEDIKE